MSNQGGVPKCPVSAIVLTRNEERNISACLRSLTDFSQVFVVDSGSTDDTTGIATEMGAIVVPFEWDGRYPKKKQWCLDHLAFSHDWVIYVDADERVTPSLTSEISRVVRSEPAEAGFFVQYDYVFMGRVLRHGLQARKLVLLNRTKARFLDYDDLDVKNMWEVEGHYQPQVNGSVGTLVNRMIHHDADDLYDYFHRHNRYSDWEAVLRLRGKYVNPGEPHPPLRKMMKAAFDLLPLKGMIVFVYSYLVRLGFLDGSAGFHFAMAKAFYYWQVGAKMRALKQGQQPVTR